MHKPRFFCFENFQNFRNYRACALMFNTDLFNTDENRINIQGLVLEFFVAEEINKLTWFKFLFVFVDGESGGLKQRIQRLCIDPRFLLMGLYGRLISGCKLLKMEICKFMSIDLM